MLSILIPTYNYGLEPLLKALKVQIAEATETVEVLVCDDNSSNLELHQQNLETSLSLGFEYHRNKQNLGRTATRNYLAENANYDCLLFLDADVLPVHSDFVKKYLAALSEGTDVICGGIAYMAEKPDNTDQMLRWKYGHKKEMKSVAQRRQNPFTVVSANLLVTKTIFKNCNPKDNSSYGLDNIFSDCLKAQNATVEHIDNPVYHLGLESNQAFVKKSIQSIDTTILAEAEGSIESNSRPIQKAYIKLKKWGAIPFFKVFTKLFKSKLESNLKAANPSIFWFDIYRLNYYLSKKR